jgi:hypothetical protein
VSLRGQGTGHVLSMHGLDRLPAGVSSLVVESRLPEPRSAALGQLRG